VEHGICLVVEALKRVNEIDDKSDDDSTDEDYTMDSTNHSDSGGDNDSCVSEGTPDDVDYAYIPGVERINNDEDFAYFGQIGALMTIASEANMGWKRGVSWTLPAFEHLRDFLLTQG
jgi:hypothetical protein